MAASSMAAAQADQLLEDSDPLAAATWHHILDRIERLQAKAPTEGEKRPISSGGRPPTGSPGARP